MFFITFLLNSTVAICQYTVHSLPNPKDQGHDFYVSNPDHILSATIEKELNDISVRIDSLSKAEYAIVVVEDFEGEVVFDFALDLFNTWGIGKKASNNGLLLFIAKNRREYRFISGYGMEGIFPDIYLKRVGEKYLVPNFRNEDYDQGVLEASEFIEKILTSANSVRELEAMMPVAIPFWSFKNVYTKNSILILVIYILIYIFIHFISLRIAQKAQDKIKPIAPIFWGIGCMLLLMFFSLFIFAFVFHNLGDVYQWKNLPYFVLIVCSLIVAMKYTNGYSTIKELYKDEEQRQQALGTYANWLFIPMLLAPLAWVDFILFTKSKIANKGRFTPPDDSGYWERILRADGSKIRGMLSQGQKNEERIKARRYEIWRNKQNGKLNFVPWEINNRYKQCPSCNFYTLELNDTKVIRPATYSSMGEGQYFDKCHNCSYRLNKDFFKIAKKVRSSSSSDGGSSSGGSSSGGGSSSFGGGSSGGGGAGGRW